MRLPNLRSARPASCGLLRRARGDGPGHSLDAAPFRAAG